MTHLRETPWDKRNFNINTYEVLTTDDEALQETDQNEGHYTLKVRPLENPKPLLDHGFYYVDTLIEPVCKKDNLTRFSAEHASLSKAYDPEEILKIASEVFVHGRFHRDFNIPNSLADKRYMNWVNDLINDEKIIALNYDNDTAGFYGLDGDKVLLLGMREEYRSRGLAKAFTSMACSEQLKSGYDELRTSISAANVASLNLFYALGFRLKNTVDVYHKLNGEVT
ncbi:Acetyltransferase (GNAT) family protein [Lentibacillus persicus]|uniref:Acetyltransferase (GNAT) family protein n=1 Tax=Lentibacillus persicus TaxID=640948 RepID=A0A1I1YRV7_9BACI|nr:GNAT family N-acetyltransferase [Lentibacillus persicus]SFE22211.1 Acetyltransferase (GNAT) family protein [Lentibacillus persicus]